MAIFVIAMVCYSIVGMILFRDNKNFASLFDAFMLLTSNPLIKLEFYLFPGTTIAKYLGYLFFWAYLCGNFFLVRNIIVAQLATTFKRVSNAGNTMYLLTALSVREVAEADGKYSAVISAPFPVSLLNLVFGSIVLGAKSPDFNLFVLHLYYFPVMIVLLGVFFVY